MKREKRIALYKKIWCKIRYWQSLKDVTDTELAAYLQVTERIRQKCKKYYFGKGGQLFICKRHGVCRFDVIIKYIKTLDKMCGM